MPRSNRLINKLAKTPKVHNVEVDEGTIYQNGVPVGSYYHGGELWANLHGENYGQREFFFRIKYGRDKTQKALEYIFGILERMTPEEYIAKRNTPNPANALAHNYAPAEILAEAMGYTSREWTYISRGEAPPSATDLHAKYPNASVEEWQRIIDTAA